MLVISEQALVTFRIRRQAANSGRSASTPKCAEKRTLRADRRVARLDEALPRSISQESRNRDHALDRDGAPMISALWNRHVVAHEVADSTVDRLAAVLQQAVSDRRAHTFKRRISICRTPSLLGQGLNCAGEQRHSHRAAAREPVTLDEVL